LDKAKRTKKLNIVQLKFLGKVYISQYDVMMPSVNLKREVAKYLRAEEQTAGMIATAGQAQGLRLSNVNYPPLKRVGFHCGGIR